MENEQFEFAFSRKQKKQRPTMSKLLLQRFRRLKMRCQQ